MEINQLLDWVPVFIILVIIVIGVNVWRKSSMKYKIEFMKNQKKIEKEKETIGGALNDLISSAPEKLKQCDSELATLHQRAKEQNLTPEQEKKICQRLEQERDMLQYAVKYGDLAKPLTGTIGKLFDKVLSKVDV